MALQVEAVGSAVEEEPAEAGTGVAALAEAATGAAEVGGDG